MSNFEWLAGEVILPAADVATIKRAFRTRHNAVILDAYEKLKRFRVDNLTSSVPKWRAAIAEMEQPEVLPASTRIAMRVAKALERPRAAKWDDFDAHHWGKAGVSTNTFPLFDERGQEVGEVSFRGRSMTWTIHEHNHAVDNFRDAQDSKFLYQLLEDIVWARGTGGGETYGCEAEEAPQLVQRFGPRGKRVQPLSKP